MAIAYTNREPAEDLDALLHHVRDNAAALGIDGDRIGVWGCSGNVPLALSALMQHGRAFVTCGALLYGYMLDLDARPASRRRRPRSASPIRTQESRSTISARICRCSSSARARSSSRT